MNKPLWEERIQYSPFRIFIRDGNRISDQELLNNLGLVKYYFVEDNKNIEWMDISQKLLFILETGNWKHIIDDFTYNVWHHPEVKPRIKKLSKSFDILYCSIGDSDESFDFVYYEKGKLRRKLVVHSPNYGDRVKLENTGEPYSFEDNIFNQSSTYKVIHDTAKSFGIRIEDEKDLVKFYKKSVVKGKRYQYW